MEGGMCCANGPFFDSLFLFFWCVCAILGPFFFVLPSFFLLLFWEKKNNQPPFFFTLRMSVMSCDSHTPKKKFLKKKKKKIWRGFPSRRRPAPLSNPLVPLFFFLFLIYSSWTNRTGWTTWPAATPPLAPPPSTSTSNQPEPISFLFFLKGKREKEREREKVDRHIRNSVDIFSLFLPDFNWFVCKKKTKQNKQTKDVVLLWCHYT